MLREPCGRLRSPSSGGNRVCLSSCDGRVGKSFSWLSIFLLFVHSLRSAKVNHFYDLQKKYGKIITCVSKHRDAPFPLREEMYPPACAPPSSGRKSVGKNGPAGPCNVQSPVYETVFHSNNIQSAENYIYLHRKNRKRKTTAKIYLRRNGGITACHESSRAGKVSDRLYRDTIENPQLSALSARRAEISPSGFFIYSPNGTFRHAGGSSGENPADKAGIQRGA